MSDVPCSLQLESISPAVYREYAPPSGLAGYLVCAWSLEIGKAGQPHRQRVLPDGCSDIVWIGEAPIVVGPMTRSILSTSDPGKTIVGLRFRPEAAACMFGVPAHEMADRHIALDQLWRRDDASEMSERVLARRSAAGRVAAAHSFLASRRHATAPLEPLIKHAMSLLSTARHRPVETLADMVGVSGRHLRRRFLAAVGYSPKLFQRILRFQRLLAIAQAQPAARLGDLAVLAGYADQAHMTREVSEFAGVPPSALLGSVVSALYRFDQTASS